MRSLPCHIVPIQLKNFTPVGTAISSVIALKNGLSTAPVVNMWCAHTPGRQRPDRERGEHEPGVPEQRLAAEHRDDLGDDAEERAG